MNTRRLPRRLSGRSTFRTEHNEYQQQLVEIVSTLEEALSDLHHATTNAVNPDAAGEWDRFTKTVSRVRNYIVKMPETPPYWEVFDHMEYLTANGDEHLEILRQFVQMYSNMLQHELREEGVEYTPAARASFRERR